MRIGDEILMSSDDKEKVKDLLEKHSAYMKEIEKAYADGKYTKNEMEAILQDRNCSIFKIRFYTDKLKGPTVTVEPFLYFY